MQFTKTSVKFKNVMGSVSACDVDFVSPEHAGLHDDGRDRRHKSTKKWGWMTGDYVMKY